MRVIRPVQLASLAALLLAGCATPPAPTVGHLASEYHSLAVKGARKTPSPSPTPTPTPTPIATSTPMPTPTPTPTSSPSAQPIVDLLAAGQWQAADGWTNGSPFWCGWQADHLQVANGTATLKLDDVASSGQPYTSAELRSSQPVGFGRVEGKLRAAKGSGLVTSLITYTGPAEGTVHDEVDIEILGKDTTRMQVNYFTAGVGGHEVLIDLGFDAAAGVHSYAFEWTASDIRWYVDGRLVHTEDGSRGALPTTPGKVMANLWPGINVDGWLGTFTYPGQPITAEYQGLTYQAF